MRAQRTKATLACIIIRMHACAEWKTRVRCSCFQLMTPPCHPAMGTWCAHLPGFSQNCWFWTVLWIFTEQMICTILQKQQFCKKNAIYQLWAYTQCWSSVDAVTKTPSCILLHQESSCYNYIYTVYSNHQPSYSYTCHTTSRAQATLDVFCCTSTAHTCGRIAVVSGD